MSCFELVKMPMFSARSVRMFQYSRQNIIMFQVFKDLAKSQKLELKSIDSQLYVHEADIYRCKSLLLSQRSKYIYVRLG